MIRKLQDLKPIDEGWEIHTNNGVFQTRYVVNAAGVYADKFHNMVSEKKIHITPRRGDYCLLDKSAGSHVSKTIFALPGKYGKGILVAPTVHGNLILADQRRSISKIKKEPIQQEKVWIR